MPPAKKMKIRTIVTSAVASVAVVGAVLLPVMLRGNNKTEGEPTNTSALIELDDGTVENSAYSRISAYSAFSDISLPSREKPYYEAFSKGSATEPEPTAGEETSRTEKTSKTSSGSSSAEDGSSNTQPRTTDKEPVISEISLLRLINSTHPLPSNFVPQTAKMDGQYVGRVIYPHLKEMLDDARSEGVYMFIRSGYRSYASQESVLNSFINKYRNRGYSYEEARRLALQTASLPGCSEHQSGLAVDINATGGTSSYTAYAWLAKNAYKYGFILRYPSGKESITGIEYEPWHYRYVGIGEAEKIKDSGLCLEEYLGG